MDHKLKEISKYPGSFESTHACQRYKAAFHFIWPGKWAFYVREESSKNWRQTIRNIKVEMWAHTRNVHKYGCALFSAQALMTDIDFSYEHKHKIQETLYPFHSSISSKSWVCCILTLFIPRIQGNCFPLHMLLWTSCSSFFKPDLFLGKLVIYQILRNRI